MRIGALVAGVAIAVALLAGRLLAQPAQGQAAVEAAIKGSWTKSAPDWQARLEQDETQKLCSQYRNAPPKNVADAIVAREKAGIEYPADGKFMGDWKKGEKLAQSGYGGRFTDYPPRAENGGNCYACHQLDKKELSFGTLGPSLLEYGKNRRYAEAEIKAVYERIYNSQATIPCANMPRLGASKFLAVEQIKDLVAYVMSPESPVNK
jgi:L-cysteine S-thiosulfotransferase